MWRACVRNQSGATRKGAAVGAPRAIRTFGSVTFQSPPTGPAGVLSAGPKAADDHRVMA
jgi:hypothetical protein